MAETSDLPTTAVPLSMRGRSIAPDLARGAMLLLIAIANAPTFLWGADRGSFGAHALDGSLADKVVQAIAIVTIDGRVYPMFAFLFGYGIVQMYQRQTAAGVSPQDARRLLRRRHWWMLAFGFLHAALLWFGDILGTYGLAGLLLVWLFLDRPDRTIRRWVIALVTLLAVGSLGASLIGWVAGQTGPAPADLSFGTIDSVAETNLLIAAGMRIWEWALLGIPAGLFGLLVPISILLGFLAARHRVLDDPAAHVPLLKRAAVIGLIVGWGTGLAAALQHLDVWGLDAALDPAFVPLQYVGGLFGGLGYVAVFGLIAVRLERDRSTGGDSGRGIAGAVQALGKRSLSGYLAQSIVFAPLLSAWGFGLGATMTSWSVTALAVAIWAVTVAVAANLERDGRRGPAERALRYLVYPRR